MGRALVIDTALIGGTSRSHRQMQFIADRVTHFMDGIMPADVRVVMIGRQRGYSVRLPDEEDVGPFSAWVATMHPHIHQSFRAYPRRYVIDPTMPPRDVLDETVQYAIPARQVPIPSGSHLRLV